MEKIIGFIGGSIFLYLSYLVLMLIHHENFIAYILIILATIIFIIAAMFYSMVLSGPVSKPVSFIIKIVYALMGIFLLYVGIMHIINAEEGTEPALAFTVILIEALYFLFQAAPNIYNNMVDKVYVVDDLREPLDSLCEKFQSVETPYGRPWLGKVKMLPEKCIIYGPTSNDSYLFCNYASGRFTITVADDISYLEENKDLEDHRLTTEIGFSNYDIGQIQNIISMLYPKMYYEMFSHFVKTGETKWVSSDYEIPVNDNIYGFDEDFKIKKQEYHLLNQDGKAIYDINSDFVRKTFIISSAQTGDEVLKITKRIFHIMPKYDFYKDGQKYGSLRQKVAFTRDVFKLNTIDGVIEVREINTTIGVNYAVFLNGKVLGIISEKINMNLKNIIFDNYILTVFNDKYMSLLSGLAIMAEREKVRDRRENQ